MMMEPTTRNVLRLWRSATPEQLNRGIGWYENAYGAAASLDPHNPERAAGVIAALSPRNSWPRNLELASRAYAEGSASGTLTRSTSMANIILAGTSPSEALRGPKVRAFYECIVHSGSTTEVCIDRHAIDVAIGARLSVDQRGAIVLSKGGRYEKFADIYRRAARRVGVDPPVMQAVTWVTWREQYGWTRVHAQAA